MKKLLVLLVITSWFGCSSKPVDSDEFNNRTPANIAAAQVINKCGEVGYNETSYSALNPEDVMYIMRLDCNLNRQIDREDGGVVIGLPVNELKPQQKAWLTRWKKMAVRSQKNALASPYLCMKVTATQDPCLSKKSVLGFKPSFTSKVLKVQATR